MEDEVCTQLVLQRKGNVVLQEGEARMIEGGGDVAPGTGLQVVDAGNRQPAPQQRSAEV